jgi:hypothetical protein
MRKTTAHIQQLNPMPSGVGRLSHASQLRHAHGTAPRVLNCYALVYLIRGEGWLRDALGNNQSIREGQGFLLFPGVKHEYRATTTDGWTELHVFFEGTAFDSWREAGLLDPARPVFTCEPADRWAHRLKQVWQAAANPLDQVLRLQGFLMDCGLVATAPRPDNPELCSSLAQRAPALVTLRFASGTPTAHHLRAIRATSTRLRDFFGPVMN